MKAHGLTVLLFVLLVILFGVQSCHVRQNMSNEVENAVNAENAVNVELYYEQIVDSAGTNWDEEIPVFHYWRDISSDNYYFDIPTEDSINGWMKMCEERNPCDSVERRYVQDLYTNMNQYVTVNDFYHLWYHDGSYLKNDDFTTWRLMQYDSTLCVPSPNSEYDKFYSIKNTIQRLLEYEPECQWELNCHSGYLCDFQEYYDRLLVKEAIKHSNNPKLIDALKKEQEAWQNYHIALDTAFQIIDGSPDGMVGSAWSMAICGILLDNAAMREQSLVDFYFALTDSLDYQNTHKSIFIGRYDIERHKQISNKQVIKEYGKFMDFFKDKSYFNPEFRYPEKELKRVLEDEMNAWQVWMSSRDIVSAILTGLCKDCYDNATNNVRRHKLIMLKNRYQGFGITTQTILDCLLPYDCKDSEIDSFSFEKRWNADQEILMPDVGFVRSFGSLACLIYKNNSNDE